MPQHAVHIGLARREQPIAKRKYASVPSRKLGCSLVGTCGEIAADGRAAGLGITCLALQASAEGNDGVGTWLAALSCDGETAIDRSRAFGDHPKGWAHRNGVRSASFAKFDMSRLDVRIGAPGNQRAENSERNQ